MALNYYREYRLKFYLNARHYIILNGQRGEVHPHTWEFALHIRFGRGSFVEFHKFENGMCSVCRTPEQTTDEPDQEVRVFLTNETAKRDIICSYWEDETLRLAEMEEGDVVWAATYDETGRLTGIHFIPYVAGQNIVSVKISSREAKLRLFWLDTGSRKPQSKAVNVWPRVDDDAEEA